jgi:hypothetical protein
MKGYRRAANFSADLTALRQNIAKRQDIAESRIPRSHAGEDDARHKLADKAAESAGAVSVIGADLEASTQLNAFLERRPPRSFGGRLYCGRLHRDRACLSLCAARRQRANAKEAPDKMATEERCSIGKWRIPRG